MGDLVQGGVVKAVGAEGGDKFREAGGVADGGWDGGAVEVGAQSDSIDAETVDEVGEVADDRIQACVGVAMGVGTEIIDAEIEADDAV